MHSDEHPITGAQLTQLLADLNPNRVASRKQGNANLSYLEAWDIRASLIRVFGFGGWSAELIESEILSMTQSAPSFEYNANKNAPKVQKIDALGKPIFNWVVAAKCTMRVTIHQLGAVYTEAAVASQTGPDIGEVTDFAVKTAESDAFKRCCINLGTTFGLSLYDSGSTQDVVRRVLDPHQQETLRKYAEEQAAKRKDPGQLPTVGSGADAAPDGPDASAVEAATAQAAKAFQRS